MSSVVKTRVRSFWRGRRDAQRHISGFMYPARYTQCHVKFVSFEVPSLVDHGNIFEQDLEYVLLKA